MNLKKIREDFPLFKSNSKIIYFDSTATSLKPIPVIQALEKHYFKECANIHRGVHVLSQKASDSYEKARKSVAGFINASQKELAFTKNTTESINFIAESLLKQGFFKKNDEIIVSLAEHHSNFLPWKKLESIGVKIKIIGITNDFLLNLNEFESMLSNKTKLVSLFHMSNTIGSINPVKKLTKKVHETGALMCIDAAQSAPHLELNVKNINCDFMAFSAHKMLGPTGIGALYIKEKLISEMPPVILGGGMISNVSLKKINYLNGIEKFEAGTPNIAGAYGFQAACNYLNKIGMQKIRIHEKKLTEYAFNKLNELNNVELYCNGNPENQGGIMLFSVKGIDAHDVAEILNENNIAVRSGNHCAQPLMNKFNKNGLVRASFYLYNSEQEIDSLIKIIKKLN